jgi:hypothetical protein
LTRKELNKDRENTPKSLVLEESDLFMGTERVLLHQRLGETVSLLADKASKITGL